MVILLFYLLLDVTILLCIYVHILGFTSLISSRFLSQLTIVECRSMSLIWNNILEKI